MDAIRLGNVGDIDAVKGMKFFKLFTDSLQRKRSCIGRIVAVQP